MEAQHTPLNIARVVVTPGSRLLGLKLDLVNRPSSFASVLTVTAEDGFNVLCGLVEAAAPSDERASMLLILDATSSSTSSDQLLEKLRGLPDVMDVKMAKPEVDGLFIDPFHFPILVGSTRAMTLTCTSFVNAIEHLKRELGSAGEAILFYEGVAAGEAMEREWRPLLSSFTGEQVFASVLRILRSLGWLIGEVLKWDERGPEVIVRAYELFECRLAKAKDKPNSQFFRGLITGLARSLLKRDVVAVETRCVAKGDPFCEFVVKLREEAGLSSPPSTSSS